MFLCIPKWILFCKRFSVTNSFISWALVRYYNSINVLSIFIGYYSLGTKFHIINVLIYKIKKEEKDQKYGIMQSHSVFFLHTEILITVENFFFTILL